MPISALKMSFKDGKDCLRTGNGFHEKANAKPGRFAEPLWDSNC